MERSPYLQFKMANGLILDLDQFKKLPTNEKFNCLYENQCKTLSAIKGYKFNQKVQYAWLSTITATLIFIIKHAISK